MRYSFSKKSSNFLFTLKIIPHIVSKSSFFIAMLFVIFSQTTIAQPYNNSWINHSQSYYKFKIANTGIYRIDSNTLANAGIPISAIDARNIQIFARGLEIPLHIEGESDGVFNSTDYIEFYAQKNDGWFEEDFYGGSSNHPNPYYSLINDTICYFLTWNNITSNNRYSLETDINFGAYTPIPSFNKEVVSSFSTNYFAGETVAVGGSSLSKFGYNSTEGWFDLVYNVGQTRTKNISSKNSLIGGTGATLEAVVLGESNYASITTGDHHLEVSLAGNVFDLIYDGYQKIDVQLTFPTSDLGSTTTPVNFKSINDLGTPVDRQAIAFLKLTYPHTLDLEGLSVFDKIFVSDNMSGTKSYLNISNFTGTGNVVFYDLTNNKRISVVSSGSNHQVLVPNNGNEKECYITYDSEINNITSLTAVNGNGTFTNFLTSSVDSAFIIITHPSLITEANAYSSYRTTTGHNPFVVNIEELYDQFAFGIEKHPYSIRNFIDFIADNWSVKPHNLFLLGKAIKAIDSRQNNTFFHNNLVPSFGVPASDHMLTAGLNGTINEPVIPTGRLAATNGTEVNWYLNKIIQYENPAPSSGAGETDWMKRILHFAGGTILSEAALFSSYLANYEAIIEDTLFGGNVHPFSKTTSNPIQISLTDSIKNFIGDGVALMTFFGHGSATGGFDQNIDNPTSWPNQNGKYPFLLGNACLTGDIHLTTNNSVSETYVIIEDKGVIGFLASVDLGLTSYLNTYSTEFYHNLSHKNYNKSVGSQIVNTIKNIQGTGNSYFTNSTCLGMSLHGDPAVIINAFEKPDFMINSSSINISPAIVTSELDSFDINITIKNLGNAVNDTIIMKLTRVYPEIQYGDTAYVKVFKSPNYEETYTFTLPVDPLRGLGNNNFNVSVDVINQVSEIWETNNDLSFSVNIQSGNLTPIYPFEYAIVPSQGVTLKASTANPFEPAKNYIFQLDTTDLFNNPIESTIINQAGGIYTWSPTTLQNMPDSMVYFWRISKDSVDATGYRWKERSFQYIPGKEGWEQDHFFQFKNDGFQFLDYNRTSRSFDFINGSAQLKVLVQGALTSTETSNNKVLLDADAIANDGWTYNTAIHTVVLDSLSLEPWDANQINMGQANVPGTGIPNNFIFRNGSPAQMDALAYMLIDSVPDNNYIVVWSWYPLSFSNYNAFTPSLANAFQSLGSTLLPSIQDSLPFCFFVKKGNLATVLEAVGDSIDHKNLSISTTLTTNANYANIFSEILGPASSWDSLSWRTSALELNTTKDSSILNVYGVDMSGNETLIIPNLPTDSADILITNQINAAAYPYLKLNSYLADDSLFTAPQLNRWHVTYSEAPEAALAPKINFSFSADTVNEGENIKLTIAIKNVSIHDMDSLLISFSVIDQYNGVHFLPYARQQPLLADSIFIATIEFSSYGYPGLNSLSIDVNPNNDQLEQYHFNNVAQIPFFVLSDKINPILDVTFDGIHILDGDIVSPTSEIVIELTDENRYLALDDTSDYAVYITYPNGTEKRKYFYMNGQQVMHFIPGSLPKNKSKIIYKDNFTTDGIYKLRVQANDKTKNNSGNSDYVINFEVINHSSITNIVNYPNPFTTATKFVFTLTGSQIPDVFKIQIITITGKVIREINKEEIGNINIGRNISEFTWNGTDTYGDRLANGLYLYRVITKIDGENIDHRSSNADQFFKENFGKMYLFR